MNVTIRDTTDRAGALHQLQRAADRSGDGSTAAQLADGAHVLDVVKHGRVVGALAISILGQCATIRGAASEGDFVDEDWPVIHDALLHHGVTHVAFFTVRPGLIRKMQRAGFTVAHCEMEKVL